MGFSKPILLPVSELFFEFHEKGPHLPTTALRVGAARGGQRQRGSVITGSKFHWSSCVFLCIKLDFDFFLHYGRGVEFSG